METLAAAEHGLPTETSGAAEAAPPVPEDDEALHDFSRLDDGGASGLTILDDAAQPNRV